MWFEKSSKTHEMNQHHENPSPVKELGFEKKCLCIQGFHSFTPSYSKYLLGTDRDEVLPKVPSMMRWKKKAGMVSFLWGLESSNAKNDYKHMNLKKL